MAPNGDECIQFHSVFSRALLFSLSSWYDILRVPINLDSRVGALFPWNLPSIKNIQFEWSDSNCAHQKISDRSWSFSFSTSTLRSLCDCFNFDNFALLIFNFNTFKFIDFDLTSGVAVMTSKTFNLNTSRLNIVGRPKHSIWIYWQHIVKLILNILTAYS